MHRLALALGRTVGELLDSLDSAELVDWQAFYLIDPWGDQRADLRAGILAAATVNGNPFRRGSAAQPKDFMPFRDDGGGRSTLTTPDEMEAFFRAYADAYGE